LNCPNIRAQLRSAKASTSTSGRRAKRARPPPDSGDVANDDSTSAGTEDTGIAGVAQGIGVLGEKDKGRARAKAHAKRPKAGTAVAPALTSKLARARARVPVQGPHERESGGGNSSKTGSVSASAPAPAPATEPAPSAPAARKRGRQPQSRQLSDAKPRNSASSAMTDPEGKVRKRRKVAA